MNLCATKKTNTLLKNMEQNKNLLITISIIVTLAVGFWVGGKLGFNKGYRSAQADAKKVQEEATKKATEEAARTANPFQAINPLSGVEVNPFEKAKKILNPFK